MAAILTATTKKNCTITITRPVANGSYVTVYGPVAANLDPPIRNAWPDDEFKNGKALTRETTTIIFFIDYPPLDSTTNQPTYLATIRDVVNVTGSPNKANDGAHALLELPRPWASPYRQILSFWEIRCRSLRPERAIDGDTANPTNSSGTIRYM